MHLTVRIIGARPGGKQEEDIRRSVTPPKTMRPKKTKIRPYSTLIWLLEPTTLDIH